MKWRISFDWEPKGEDAFGVAFLVGAIWFLTTFAFHLLQLTIFDLPAAPNYRTGDDDITVAYLLPILTLVPLILVCAFYGIENSWRRGFILRSRLSYIALSLALLFWCWWSLRSNLSYGHGNRFHGYGIPSDTIQAAAYASVGFPLAVACICLLLAVARRSSTHAARGMEGQL